MQTTLTFVHQGSWSDASPGGPITINDQWVDCSASDPTNDADCAPVQGNTAGGSYTVQSSDVGFVVEVSETASDSNGTSQPTLSNATNEVVPVSTSAPSISPSTSDAVGSTVTVTQGTWSPSGSTISDEWVDCSPSDPTDVGSCMPADGAVTGNQYTVDAHDLGQVVEVEETATYNGTPSSPVLSNATNEIVPVNQTAPSISPTSGDVVGTTVTGSQGTWNPSGSTLGDTWVDCNPGDSTNAADCLPVAQQPSGLSYTIQDSDAGYDVELEETATDNGATSAPQLSNATSQIPSPPPVNTSAPTISGGNQPGDVVTASPGAWTNSPTSYVYQWYSCSAAAGGCVPIDGATGQTYTLTDANVGGTVLVEATAGNTGGQGSPAFSTQSPVVQTTSAVSLSLAPGAPAVNKLTTMTATVTSTAPQGAPDGTMTFTNRGQAIGGCVGLPVAPTGQSVTVQCSVDLVAQQALLQATYTPVSGSDVLGSASGVVGAAIARSSTTTSLDVTPTVTVRRTTTYTATVAPPSAQSGPMRPSGTVAFLDDGRAISGCAAQRLSDGGATCTVSYAGGGTHEISARYGGDANFTGSTSQADAVRAVLAPAKGSITATMQWTFHYTPTYTRVLELVVNGLPTGATVLLGCRGHGCPFHVRRHTVRHPAPCSRRQRRRHACPGVRYELTSAFAGRRLGVGARVVVLLLRSQYVGKYYRFTVRARRQPKVQISCLALGSTRPGAGCTG